MFNVRLASLLYSSVTAVIAKLHAYNIIVCVPFERKKSERFPPRTRVEDVRNFGGHRYFFPECFIDFY